MASKSLHQLRVEEFMKKAEQRVPERPLLPSAEIRHLRARLIFEEALETIGALGFSIQQIGPGAFDLAQKGEPNLVDIVDGCADLSVVNVGTLAACGVADAEILEAVDINNLAKFGPGSYRREDGKWIKPPGHPLPPIRELLLKQGCKERI